MNTHTDTPAQDKEHAAPLPSDTVAAAAVPATDIPAQPLKETIPLMDDQGAFAPEWYKRFAELAPYATTLAKFRRPEALAKSYANLERLKGYPGTGDTRRMEAFRLAVGLPEKAEEFHLVRPDNTPDEVWDDALASGMARVAYEYGVPAEAMQALTAHYASESGRMLKAYQDANQEAIEQADAQLQQEWGSHYEDNMHSIGAFLTRMGEQAGVDVAALMESPALRANADFAKLMLAAAGLMQEAPLHTGAPADSAAEARRIASDPTHPLYEAYMRTSHPQHRYANEQYDRLAFGHRL